MNNLTFTGKVSAILPYQQGVSKTGNQWIKMTFIVEETDQQYPQRAVFSMMGQERIQNANLQLNEMVTVHFNLGAHQNPNNPAQWFSDINAWKIERPQAQQPIQQPQGFAQPQYAPQPQMQAQPSGPAPLGGIAQPRAYAQPAPQQTAPFGAPQSAVPNGQPFNPATDAPRQQPDQLPFGR